MPTSDLDAKDAKIVGMLKEDSRASTQAIADALGMPRVTVHDRIRRLQERGVVRRFTVELGKEELGWSLHAFILANWVGCLLYTSPSPRDQRGYRMPSSA